MGEGRFYCQSYCTRVEVLRMLSYPSARLALKGDRGVLSSTEWGFTKWQTHVHDIHYEISHHWIPRSWPRRNMQWRSLKGNILAQTPLGTQVVIIYIHIYMYIYIYIFKVGIYKESNNNLIWKRYEGDKRNTSLFLPSVVVHSLSVCPSHLTVHRIYWSFAANLSLSCSL